MKNAKLTTLICGLIAIAATVIFYFLIYDNIFSPPIRWISLLFLIIAQSIGIAKALLAKKDLITQASIFTSCAHFVVTIIISILFLTLFPLKIKAYILLNLLALCALTPVDLFLMHFGKSLSSSNKKLAQSQGIMSACYAKAQTLVALYGQGKYTKNLLEIAELIKYADNSALTGDEATVMDKLEKLDQLLKENDEHSPALIDEIKITINMRTIKMKNIKKGGY